MTAKQYLFKIRSLDTDRQKARDALKTYRARILAPGSVNYSSIRVQGSAGPDMADQIDCLLILEEKLADAEVNYWRRVIVAQTLLLRLPNETHRHILSRFFLDGRTVQQIAREDMTTESAIYTGYSRALKSFQEINEDLLTEYTDP